MQRKTKMQEELEKLMERWKEYSKTKWSREHFVTDGKFPQYEKQKIKVLFIARESYGQKDNDYWKAWEQEEMNITDNFHSRLLYLAYGILNGEQTIKNWEEMPPAKNLNDDLARKGKFSFAFINASKLNNCSGSTRVQAGKFAEFINDPQNQAFFLEEIEILNPDIIVSGNLRAVGMMTPFLRERFLTVKDVNENFHYYDLNLKNKKTIPWLDGWHFSASKCTFENFYLPICTKAKEILNKKK